MTQVFKNRAFVYTATTGTGTITLGSAVSGYQTFGDAGVADTNTVRYLILDDSDAWEIGTGTYTASGTTLARSVEESSNADALLDLTGNATVAVIVDAADITSLLSNLFENPLFLRERSSASADQAAYGQLWVKNTTPNELWFTDDAGNDFQVSDALLASQLLDEDDMASDSATSVPSQQSVKKYVDDSISDVLQVRHEKASGVGGGSLASGTWTKHDLNTTVRNNITGASVASGQITLPAGTYEVDGHGEARIVYGTANRTSKVRLRNVTDNSTAISGAAGEGSGYAGTLNDVLHLPISGVFTLADTKTFELQMYAASSGSTLGFPAGTGEQEVYAALKIRRIV